MVLIFGNVAAVISNIAAIFKLQSLHLNMLPLLFDKLTSNKGVMAKGFEILVSDLETLSLFLPEYVPIPFERGYL